MSSQKYWQKEMRDENTVITENMGLVHACARRFVGRGIEYEDLFQAGCLGLTKAALKFDEDRGLKFSTYAVPVILGEIKGLFRYGTALKISRGIKELSGKVAAETEKYRNQYGCSPTVGILAQILGVEPEKITEAIGASSPPASLTLAEEAEERDIPQEAPQEELTDFMALRQVMDSLPEEDRRLIVLRYFGNKTQKETAQVLGVTQVQVSRKEKKILLAMRSKMLSS